MTAGTPNEIKYTKMRGMGFFSFASLVNATPLRLESAKVAACSGPRNKIPDETNTMFRKRVERGVWERKRSSPAALNAVDEGDWKPPASAGGKKAMFPGYHDN